LSFWLLAVAITACAALVLCWPLLSRQSPSLRGGLILLLLIPLGSLGLYQVVGTPAGIDVQGRPEPGHASLANGGEAGDLAEMTEHLRKRLEQQPDDIEGWVLLGRSYKAMQQYDKALEVLRHARELAPNEPLVAVELAEAMIFTSGGNIQPEVRALLESAVQQQPDLQKGLWLLGIVASQDGDDNKALEYWERLLPMLQPGSGVAGQVLTQINQARGRLGKEPLPVPAGPMAEMASAAPVEPAAAPASGPASDWPGVQVVVSVPDNFGPVPDGAVLFVIARDPAAPVPPLGALRVAQPSFPLTVTLSDANSMMQQRPISGVAEVELLARLSLSGSPMPQPGDSQSEPARVATADQKSVQLSLLPPGG